MIGLMFRPGHGWWPVWILVGGLVQVVLVVGVVLLVASLIRRDRQPAGPARPSSLLILEERYARGEITREDFLERRAVLLGQTPPPPARGQAPASAPPPPPPPSRGP